MKNFRAFTEGKQELQLIDLPYGEGDLAPVMSKKLVELHYDKLAAGYVKRFNKGEGDPAFNEAGAFLHNLFFPGLQEPSPSNAPTGPALALIKSKYGSFEKFQGEVEKVAKGIQGAGWVYLAISGEIKVIHNHEIRDDIAMLIDWWEHAWMLDYGSEKDKYLKNIWQAINWTVVNDRLSRQ